MSNVDIKEAADRVGVIGDLEYWVVPNPMMQRELDGEEPWWKAEGKDPEMFDFAGYNGYVIYPKRPVREKGYWGILTYVPVHGGITYAEEDELGMVYGFDTGHHDSQQFPRKDGDWIQHQCGIMIMGITKAIEVERNYLRCTTNEGKGKHAQAVIDVVGDVPGYDGNFGININLMFGRL